MKNSILFLFVGLFCISAVASPKPDPALGNPHLKDMPHGKNDFRFVEITKTKTVEGLPPQLEVVYEKYCNEDFVKVVREDFVNPTTQKTTIAVGILVKTKPLSSCGGIQKNQKANAGNLFSGREYEVKLISIK
jgi:hypothetical protein